MVPSHSAATLKKLQRHLRAIHHARALSPLAKAVQFFNKNDLTIGAVLVSGAYGGRIKLRAVILQRWRRRPDGRSAGHGAQVLLVRGFLWDLRCDEANCQRCVKDTGAAACMPRADGTFERAGTGRRERPQALCAERLSAVSNTKVF